MNPEAEMDFQVTEKGKLNKGQILQSAGILMYL